MIRIGTVEDIGPILAAISDPEVFNIELLGEKIHVSSVRLQTFAFKGLRCTFCGKEASFFAVEKHHVNDGGFHINLYGWKRGSGHMNPREELLFTRDHIIPKSKGGPDVLENMQPACERCNRLKNDRIIGDGESIFTAPKKSKKPRKMIAFRTLWGKRWDILPWRKWM